MNTSAAVQLSFHLVLAFRESAKMSSREGRLSVGDAATASVAAQAQEILAMHCGIDHFHLLFTLHEDRTVSQFIRRLKTDCARRARDFVPPAAHALWQPGYIVVSSSWSDRDALVERIGAQDALHETCSFREEVRRLLAEHGASPKRKLPFVYPDGDEVDAARPGITRNSGIGR